MRRFVLLAGLLASPIAVQAAQPSHPCATIQSSTERLDCYDATFGFGPPAAGQTDAGQVNAEQVNARQEFGLNERELRALDPERPSKADAELDHIEATVTRVDTQSKGVVTLDNGQVWAATGSSLLGRVREGERVIIRKSRFSSGHILVAPSGVGLRVKRRR